MIASPPKIPLGRIFVDFLNRKFPAYMDTGLNLVDTVAEAAMAHVAALGKGTPGKRYILGGENLTLKQILDTGFLHDGEDSVCRGGVCVEEWIYGAHSGEEPAGDAGGNRWGRKKMFVSSAHAQQTGLPHRSRLPGHARGHRVVPRQRVRAVSRVAMAAMMATRLTARTRWRGTTRWPRAWPGRRERCGSPAPAARARSRQTSSSSPSSLPPASPAAPCPECAP